MLSIKVKLDEILQTKICRCQKVFLTSHLVDFASRVKVTVKFKKFVIFDSKIQCAAAKSADLSFPLTLDAKFRVSFAPAT